MPGGVKEQDIQALAKLQRQILANAATMVKPGGTLVYATCTTEPEENRVIKWFLETHPLQPITAAVMVSCVQKCGNGGDSPFIHGIDGFFICKMQNNQS